jgi:hypothetical protein
MSWRLPEDLLWFIRQAVAIIVFLLFRFIAGDRVVFAKVFLFTNLLLQTFERLLEFVKFSVLLLLFLKLGRGWRFVVLFRLNGFKLFLKFFCLFLLNRSDYLLILVLSYFIIFLSHSSFELFDVSLLIKTVLAIVWCSYEEFQGDRIILLIQVSLTL